MSVSSESPGESTPAVHPSGDRFFTEPEKDNTGGEQRQLLAELLAEVRELRRVVERATTRAGSRSACAVAEQLGGGERPSSRPAPPGAAVGTRDVERTRR